MSFIIAVHVNEGIVLASDRRTTYTNTEKNGDTTVQRIGIHSTDSTEKTFLCPNKAGISTCGDGSFLGKPITGYIQEMIRTKIHEECDVAEMPQIIIDFFNQFDNVPNTSFIVAGYCFLESNKKQKVYKINVASKDIQEIDTSNQGATWDGETLTLTRLIQPVALVVGKGKYQELPYEEILWSYFTLQDAIDFARYAVEATIRTMRFKNVVETVGGKVDLLVITPEGANWLQKEELK